MRMTLAAVVLAFVSSCATYRQDLETICTIDPMASELTAAAYSRSIAQRIKTDQAKALLKGLAKQPDTMAASFRWEMSLNGIKQCPYVDVLEREEAELKAAEAQLKELEAQKKKLQSQ